MIYLDCGYYIGDAEKSNCVDDTWTRFGFEPHPGIEVPEYVLRKAVWIKDGTMKFNIGGRNDASSLEGTSGHSDPVTIEVETIDFSEFVKNLPPEPIVCSMDIEGAEFAVLEKMIKDNTIYKIRFLDIEFHHRIMGDAKGPDDARSLIKQIQDRGVIIKLKVPLE